LEHAIPAPLRGWLLEVAWDDRRLGTLDAPVIDLAVASLRWQLDLPWWRLGEDGWFQVSPAMYLADPDCYPEHERRVAGVDPDDPIHVVRRRGRWLILDGFHRLVRAHVEGRASIRAHWLSPADVHSVLVD
jgi:hypothetical protein